MKSFFKLALLKILMFNSSSAFAQCNFYPDEYFGSVLDEGGGMTYPDFREHQALPYDHIREADVFWAKRIWREIDLTEKMNQNFKYQAPVNGQDYYFINVLKCIVETNEDVHAYGTGDDQFTDELSDEEFKALFSSRDTVLVYDLLTDTEIEREVKNPLNPDDVIRYRVKEDWFFDEESGTMQVRIVGIAPVVNKYDEFGNFRYAQPLFWVHYPSIRKYLANYWAFNYFNESNRMSWDDVLEMRYFSSVITKESNVFDRRIQDYAIGIDALLETERIKNEIIIFEDNLWSH